MKTRSHFMLMLSAATVGLALALAPAAFAQETKGTPMTKPADGMKKGDDMKKPDAMTKGDGMKKDEMKR